ncbi:kinesin-like protein KIF11-B isoform X2 [Symsagittifera roscoffensis]|uniref:kinesin-like protein KIF11-B isoform X2 n=1 Tax=Symsagittifera roscoffensis TaxID=84072 RepID=UPI00307C4234
MASTIVNASKSNGKDGKESNIKVFVRCRPMNSAEQKKHALPVLSLKKNEVVVRQDSCKQFTYDHVFGPNSTQLEVFEAIVHPMIQEVLLGYNCTMFAYGQTGTGKTFTMEGERSTGLQGNCSWSEDPFSGIIPRTLHMLFDKLEGQDFNVRVSYIEIYNEEIMDLMADNLGSDCAQKVKIFEDNNKKGAVILQGVEEITVKSKEHVYAILENGSKQRKTAETLMNAHSSRSHSVFSITVHMKENNEQGEEELLRTGKLNLVDLAGSENIGRSGAVEMRAQEAGSINKSLLTLGRCITSLVDKKPHVPYRESKLTRILQDSLGGRTKTSMIATVSPASHNIEETLSTLEYAHRARRITNKPEINQKMTKPAMIKQYMEEIERLKRDLAAQREQKGIFVSKENYETMESRLTEQDNYIQSLEEQMSELSEEHESVKNKFAGAESIIKAKEQLIAEGEMKLVATEAKLVDSTERCMQQKHVIAQQETNISELENYSKQLIEHIKEEQEDKTKLQTSVKRKIGLEEGNEQAKGQFANNMEGLWGRSQQSIDQLIQSNCEQSQQLNSFIDVKVQQQCNDMMNTYNSIVGSMTSDMKMTLNQLLDTCCDNGIDEIVKIVVHHFEQIKIKIQQNYDSLKSELEHKMSSEREKLNELKNNLLELEELENGRQQKLGEQKNSMNEVRQNYSRIQEQLQQLQSELTKQNDTLADITSKQEKVENACSQQVKSAQHQIKETLGSYESAISSNFESLSSSHLAKKGELERTVGETEGHVTEECGRVKGNLKEFTEKAAENVKTSAFNLETKMSEFQSAITAANEEVKLKSKCEWMEISNEQLIGLKGQLSGHLEEATTFVKTELKKDEPTGSTPHSKPHRVPNEIVAVRKLSDIESEYLSSRTKRHLDNGGENISGILELEQSSENKKMTSETEGGEGEENEKDLNQTIPMDQFYLDNKPASEPLCKWKGGPITSASKSGPRNKTSAKRAKVNYGGNPVLPKAPKLSGNSKSQSE